MLPWVHASRFLSTPSARRATCPLEPACADTCISIHALREEGDRNRCFRADRSADFYPRPPRGGRQSALSQVIAAAQFLSTPSARRATWTATLRRSFTKFLSTPSARRATLFTTTKASLITISIHALREEGDSGCRFCSCRTFYFYPRPPRGGRHRAGGRREEARDFYPRPPRGGRPCPPLPRRRSSGNFYPRPPRGGRPSSAPSPLGIEEFLSTPSARRATDTRAAKSRWVSYFYPRPPRGGRRRLKPIRMRRTDFYPRPPRGGRPRRGRCSRSVMLISIHALREEGDVLGIGQSWPDGDFYPRPPRGGRPILAALLTYALRNFYPRPPRGGRQHIDELREIAVEISIHALREEGDQRQPCIVAKLLYFYPRPPRGGRPSGGFAMGYVTKFLSTPSARRATCLQRL